MATASQPDRSLRKRNTEGAYVNNEKQILQWLEEESELSDVDDDEGDQDFAVAEEIRESSEFSENDRKLKTQLWNKAILKIVI